MPSKDDLLEETETQTHSVDPNQHYSQSLAHRIQDTTSRSPKVADGSSLREQDSRILQFPSHDKRLENPTVSRHPRHLSLDSDFLRASFNVGEPSRAFEAYGWDAYKARNEEKARRTRKARIIESKEKYTYSELLMFKVSVIPKIIWPAMMHALWATVWTVLYEVVELRFLSIPPTIISVLGVAVTLVLVFRTNTAYDRYWEGRRAWASLTGHIRNLSRFVWVCINSETKAQLEHKHGCENLLIAYAVAIKHSLRNELGHNYEDLHYLLAHLKEFSPEFSTTQIRNLPIYIIVLVTQYFEHAWSHGQLGNSDFTDMSALLSEMIECGSILERIKNTPIPFAYSVHISQTTNLYLLALPFQLIGGLHWWSIAVVLIASFILLGLDAIAADIENPFRFDKNGLHLDRFCTEIKGDVYEIITRPESFFLDWGTPYCEHRSQKPK